jgi:hypothetical protein
MDTTEKSDAGTPQWHGANLNHRDSPEFTTQIEDFAKSFGERQLKFYPQVARARVQEINPSLTLENLPLNLQSEILDGMANKLGQGEMSVQDVIKSEFSPEGKSFYSPKLLEQVKIQTVIDKALEAHASTGGSDLNWEDYVFNLRRSLESAGEFSEETRKNVLLASVHAVLDMNNGYDRNTLNRVPKLVRILRSGNVEDESITQVVAELVAEKSKYETGLADVFASKFKGTPTESMMKTIKESTRYFDVTIKQINDDAEKYKERVANPQK